MALLHIPHRDGDSIVVSGAPLLKKQSIVYTGQKMDFIWEEAGISLHFPAATLQGDIEVSVKVLTNVEDNCIMPHGYRLMPMVSAVYKITASAKLPAPVRVRMAHCAIVDKEDSLVHMVAHCTSPYRFKPYQKGNFPLGESYSEVEITRFSVWATFCKYIGLILPLAIHVVHFSDSTAHVAVTKNIPAHCKAVAEKYENATKVKSYTMTCSYTTTEITFSEAWPISQEESRVNMIPSPAQIETSIICGYEPGCIIPKIELEPEWITDGQRTEIKTQIRVKGGVRGLTFPLSFKPPMQSREQPVLESPPPQHQPLDEPSYQCQPLQVQHPNQDQPQTNQPQQQLNRSDRPTLPQLHDFPTESGVIKIIQRIGAKNHIFGIHLLNDGTGDVTGNIEADHHGNQIRITEAILKKWLEGTGKTPQSWTTLITVLRGIELNVLAKEIEDNLLQN